MSKVGEIMINEEEYHPITPGPRNQPQRTSMEDKEFRNEKGQLHRLDGPAIEDSHGTKAWYVNGKRHRLDGPAIERANGYKAWYVNGKRHRLDGPAIERANGYKAWCVNGELHRLDGPAVENTDGNKAWWVNGKYYGNDKLTLKEFLIYTKACKDFNGK
jgi:hypothetical protein